MFIENPTDEACWGLREKDLSGVGAVNCATRFAASSAMLANNFITHLYTNILGDLGVRLGKKTCSRGEGVDTLMVYALFLWIWTMDKGPQTRIELLQLLLL